MIEKNTIYCNDNLNVLRLMPSNSVNLVYLDPPLVGTDEFTFPSSNKVDPTTYWDMIRERAKELFRVLDQNGTLYCHCDWRNEANFQILFDKTFGIENLIAKIVWEKSRVVRATARYFSNTYDLILIYGKSRGITFNREFIPYSEEVTGSYKYIDEETGRRYRLVPLTGPSKGKSNLEYEFLGVTRTWRWSKEKMQEVFDQKRIIQTRPGSVPILKQYLGEGKDLSDIWTDIPQQSIERKFIKTGYPTEKPIELLRRIIRISSNEGDLVLDPFCGSGTTLDAAQELGRQWIGIDISPMACNISGERLQKKHHLIEEQDFWIKGSEQDTDALKRTPPYEFESWVLSTLKNIFTKSKDPIDKLANFPTAPESIYSATGSPTDFDLNISNQGHLIPVMIKQKENITPRDITNLSVLMRHQQRKVGIFMAYSFSEESFEEIEKLSKDSNLVILPITVSELIEWNNKTN